MTRKIPLLTLLIVSLTGCTALGELPRTQIATAQLHQANGAPAGTAVLAASGERLILSMAVVGLPEGVRGTHLHITGRCDGPNFASAGGHLNPGMRQHGTHNPAGSHLGDLPNLTVDSYGAGAITAVLPGPRGEVEAALFDSDGTAIVIHATADDYRTDPSGNSGPRIACGILTRS